MTISGVLGTCANKVMLVYLGTVPVGSIVGGCTAELCPTLPDGAIGNSTAVAMPLFITVVVRRCTSIVEVTMLNGLPEEVVNLVLDEMVDVGVTITDPDGRMCCCVSSVSLDPSAIGDTSVGSIIGGGTDAFLDCMIGNSTVLTLPLFITVVG